MINKALQNIGFKPTAYNDYNLILRIHEIHYLFWSDTLKHFAIAVKNVNNKKEAAGVFENFNTIVIPKPINTVQEALLIVQSITT